MKVAEVLQQDEEEMNQALAMALYMAAARPKSRLLL